MLYINFINLTVLYISERLSRASPVEEGLNGGGGGGGQKSVVGKVS